MTSRRDRDRDRQRYDDDDRGDRRRGNRGDPEHEGWTDRREPPREAKKPRPGLNEFFVKGEGIHREVLQREICRFLGPEAISNPKRYNGVDGYMIKAVRPFTPDMLDDLIKISESYVSEKEDMRRKGRGGLPYTESLVGRRQDAIAGGRQDIDMSDDDSYEDEPRGSRGSRVPRERMENREPGNPRDRDRYPSGRDPYALVSSQPAYGSIPAYTSQPPGTGYPVPGYAPGPSMPSQHGGAYQPVTGYPTPTYPVASRSGNTGPSYPYSSEFSGISNEPYARPSPYDNPVSREPVRSDTRDIRGYPTPGGREPRQEPRYTGYPLSSPVERDATMSGMDERYDYGTGPTVPPGRPSYTGSSRIDQSPYDRHSPDIRDPYRREAPREERRRERR